MKAIASSKLSKLRRTLISPSQMTQNRLCEAAGPSIGMSVLFIGGLDLGASSECRGDTPKIRNFSLDFKTLSGFLSYTALHGLLS